MTTTTRETDRTRTTPTRIRISPGQGLRHGVVLAERNVRSLLRYPITLVDTLLQPILFLLLFATLFGGAIAGDRGDYLQSLVPGLMVMSILSASIGTGVALNADISKGVFDRFRSLPIARSAPLVGTVLSDAMRYTIALTVLLVVGFLMGFRVQTDPLSLLTACALALLFGLTMCWASVILGMLVRGPQAAMGVGQVAIIIPTFGSNIFADPATMPRWMEAWAAVNPVSHMADTMRALTLGGEVAGPLTTSLVWIAVLNAVLFPLALRAYQHRMR
ncbi:ABC transporter permease [Nocardiopsis nanhaiensis]